MLEEGEDAIYCKSVTRVTDVKCYQALVKMMTRTVSGALLLVVQKVQPQFKCFKNHIVNFL
jgi:hypothetical protein